METAGKTSRSEAAKAAWRKRQRKKYRLRGVAGVPKIDAEKAAKDAWKTRREKYGEDGVRG